MSRAKRERKLLALLLACALLAWGTAALAAGQGRRTETGYAAVQLAAADLLEDCFRQVRTYKEELGIPLSELDYHQTGMIGESYTGITTTLASFPLISNAIASASSGVDAGIMLARRTTSGSRYVVTRITGCACRILA